MALPEVREVQLPSAGQVERMVPQLLGRALGGFGGYEEQGATR